MSSLNKREKAGLWISLLFATLSLFGIRISENARPVIDIVEQIVLEEVDNTPSRDADVLE